MSSRISTPGWLPLPHADTSVLDASEHADVSTHLGGPCSTGSGFEAFQVRVSHPHGWLAGRPRGLRLWWSLVGFPQPVVAVVWTCEFSLGAAALMMMMMTTRMMRMRMRMAMIYFCFFSSVACSLDSIGSLPREPAEAQRYWRSEWVRGDGGDGRSQITIQPSPSSATINQASTHHQPPTTRHASFFYLHITIKVLTIIIITIL